MIPLARRTLLHDWPRFLPSILAVGFSGVLLAVQVALVLGIFGSAAIPVTASTADLWAGYPGTQSVNFGRTVGPDVEMRLRAHPQVQDVEPYLWLEADWQAREGAAGSVPVFVSGIRTSPGAMLFAHALVPGLRAALDEPGAVVVDRSDLRQLGTPLGGWAWVNGRRVHLIAAIDGLRALGGVNVLASLETARTLGAPSRADGATYYVARLVAGADAKSVRRDFSPLPAIGAHEVWTAAQFARRSQLYWMFDTGAGVAVLFMALIVCVVGVVITSQSLTVVVASSSREYATLNALGASMSALGRVVVEQACWIGGIGLVLAVLGSTVLLAAASSYSVPVAMTPEAALACAAAVLVLALLSGAAALRGLLSADPASLLR
ncbi:FtsX-like permease family protein [Ramlibacter humi]|uniref:FtsX-like permease family protein n=1 Tax=Ramlibacter humi TaxID=2530451 RepID=A0A4Z0CAT1_9BURK|nr:FtsX-like permease family protein [Ramlibacter humi]TFZ08767.1 FtsX-like permease family protein [Ramlibacter humi]